MQEMLFTLPYKISYIFFVKCFMIDVQIGH